MGLQYNDNLALLSTTVSERPSKGYMVYSKLANGYWTGKRSFEKMFETVGKIFYTVEEIEAAIDTLHSRNIDPEINGTRTVLSYDWEIHEVELSLNVKSHSTVDQDLIIDRAVSHIIADEHSPSLANSFMNMIMTGSSVDFKVMIHFSETTTPIKEVVEDRVQSGDIVRNQTAMWFKNRSDAIEIRMAVSKTKAVVDLDEYRQRVRDFISENS